MNCKTRPIFGKSKLFEPTLYIIISYYFTGNEAGRATKNSLTSAFSSIFRTKKQTSTNPNSPVNHTMSSSKSNNSLTLEEPLARFGSEVKGYAMSAVILEEWLQELAAIAQEQSVLMKEIAFHIGMALDADPNAIQPNANAIHSGKKSAMIENPNVVIRANNVETSMS